MAVMVRTTRTIDTALLNIVKTLVVDARVVEHGFRGYIANVQARPAKAPTLLYTYGLGRTSHGLGQNQTMKKRRTHLETELSGLCGIHVTTRSYDDKLF